MDVLSHDFLFLASHASMAKAIHEFKLPEGVRWWNIAHSAPGTQRFGLPYRTSLPPGHRLISLAPSLVSGFARYYATDESRVDVVQNCRLLPELRGFSDLAKGIVRKNGLDQVDVCQVYPMSTPRAQAKGIRGVISVFAALKQRGASVRLVLPLAHGNAPNAEDMMKLIRAWVGAAGLVCDTDVVFISGGLPGRVVQELQQIANVFICPSVSEASPLSLMEGAMAGQVMVLNSDVPSLADVLSPDAAYFHPFGTRGDALPADQAENLADVVLARLDHPREHARREMARWRGLEGLQDQLLGVLEKGG